MTTQYNTDVDKLVEVYLQMYPHRGPYNAMTDLLREHGRKIEDFEVGQRIRTSSGLAWVTKIDPVLGYVHYVYDTGTVGHNPPYCCIPLNEFKIRKPKAGDVVRFEGVTTNHYRIIFTGSGTELGLYHEPTFSVQVGFDTSKITEYLNNGKLVYVD